VYNPKFNRQSDTARMVELIEQHPLGTWVVMLDGELLVNHIPFLVEPLSATLSAKEAGENLADAPAGTLRAHLAKANPLAKLLLSCESVTHSKVIFQGEHSYISPSLYPTKQEHGKVVPTWNYMVVHASGMPVLHTDREWLREHVGELTDTQEKKHLQKNQSAEAWKVEDAPTPFVDAQLNGIIGVEIPLDSLTGKWKLGQNRTAPDRESLQRHYSFSGFNEMTGGLSTSHD